MKSFLKRLSVLILLILTAGYSGTDALHALPTSAPPALWLPADAPYTSPRDEPCRASIPRDGPAAPQYVRLNHERTAALNMTDNLSLTLPDGMTYTAVRREMLPRPSGEAGYVWTGSLSGQPDSSVIFIVGDDQFYGRIGMPGRYIVIHRIEQDIYAVQQRELDAAPVTLIPMETDSVLETSPLPLPDASQTDQDSQDPPPINDDSNHQIDLLVIYTPAARSIMERVAGSVTLAVDGAVIQTNMILQHSGINTQLKQVHVHPVFYLEQPNEDIGADLRNLMGVSDGYMDEVHLLRDEYAADLVAMISGVWFASYSGIAPVPSPLDAAKGFSITEACNLQDTTFTEQIGLNLGSTRDVANAGLDQPVKPYGYGYQAPDAAFVTVMARRTGGICPPIVTANVCPKVEHFSNVHYSLNGQPLGSASADNARSINELAPVVAAYRTPDPDISLQIVINGGFEIDADRDRTPDFWKRSASGKVKTACKQTGYNSPCALKFSGPASRIKQKLDVTAWNETRSTSQQPILLSVWVRTKKLVNQADVRLVLRYEDDTRTVLKVEIPPGTAPTYQMLSVSGMTEQKPVRKMKLVARLASGETGKLWLDDVHVTVYAAHAAHVRELR